jgi:glycosyltransferase involved in cell wall biosynthesis
MRLLIASAYEPLNEMHGQGVIIKNTLATAGNLGSQLSIGLSLFRGGAPEKARECEIEGIAIKVEYSQPGPSLSKTSMARSLLRLPMSQEENNFIRETAAIAVQYDAVLWFGSPYDPVTHHIARAVLCPVVYHATDSITLHEERRNGRGGAWRKIIATHVESMLLRHGRFAAAIYVGAADIARVRALTAKKYHGTRLVHLPNGVDPRRFYPRLKQPSGQKTVLFAGSMCYAPNIDAAKRLVLEVLPLVKSSTRVRIVGHSPTSAIIALADSMGGVVVVTGRVEDIGAEYAAADLLVAPIALGAGMQNKVLDALACGTPVITSTLVAKGLGRPIPGVIICETAEEYAKRIDELFAADQYRVELGASAREFIEKNFTWESRTRLLMQEINESALGVPG